MHVNRVPVEYVIKRKFDLKESGTRYLRGIKHDSLVIDKKTNTFHWNSIDLHGNALTWLTKVEGYSVRQALQELEEYSGIPFTKTFTKLEEPTPIYQKLLDAFFKLGKYNRKYWYKRGYTDSTINKYKLGYTGKAYVIPIIIDGKLDNFQCRLADSKRMWNWSSRSPSLFGLDQVDSSYVFLTEGPTDAMALTQCGLPAISHNSGAGAWDTSWNSRILDFDFIYILYDNDKAGIRGSKKISKKLLSRGYVLFWPSFFANGYDINKAMNSMGESKTKEFIQEVLLEYAIHSSDISNQSYVSEVRKQIDRKVRRLL
jgi:DNA primase